MKKKAFLVFLVLLLIVSIYLVNRFLESFNENSEAIRIDNENTILVPLGKYYFDIKKFSLFNGTYIHKYSNGNVEMKDSIRNGLRNGLRIIFYENGSKEAEVNFRNNLPHGSTIGWYSNGSLYIKANYLNGKLDGEYEKWYKNGVLKIKASFVKGILNGQYIAFDINGNIKEKVIYKYDKKIKQNVKLEN